jgi:hypothetical protein
MHFHSVDRVTANGVPALNAKFSAYYTKVHYSKTKQDDRFAMSVARTWLRLNPSVST